MTACCLALDIGATKIAVGLVPDDAPTDVIECPRVLTQLPGSTPATQVADAVRKGREVAQWHNWSITRVGIGAPGIVRAPQGQIVYNGETLKNWAGIDLPGIVHTLIDAPVACHNDVRIMAYGEHLLGSGQEFADGRVLYLSLGTGVGGAIVDNGELLSGPIGCAGEVSELVCADFRGLADRCENIASGTGLTSYVNAFLDTTAGHPRGPLGWHSPESDQLSLREIVELINASAPESARAQEIIAGNIFGFGRAIGALATAFDLSAVVLAGGVAQIGELILDPFSQGFHTGALPPVADLPIRVAELGLNAPLVGAAAFARAYAV